MVNRLLILSLSVAFVLGVCVFHCKHQVQQLEDELSVLDKHILNAQESIHVLEAEWSYLNRPKRLQDLNDLYLHHKPINVKAFQKPPSSLS